MARRKLPETLEEDLVDEVTEKGLEPHNLEAFVEEQFGEVDVPLNAMGMPSLAWIKRSYKTKSAAIRYLVHEGFAIKDIAKHLGIPYQHARNVAKQPLKRGPNESWLPPSQRPQTDWNPSTPEPKDENHE